MTSAIRILVHLIVAAVFAAMLPPGSGGATHPAAPAISVLDLDGHPLELVSNRGEVVLLNFWSSSCGVCRAEIPLLVELQERYRDRGLRVIGIALDDDRGSVQAASKQLHINYPVALGENKVGAAFGGDGVPTTLLIGRDGRIYGKHSGATTLRVLEDEVTQLLAGGKDAEVIDFRPAGKSESVALPTPEELNSEVPGVDVSHLSAAQLAEFKLRLEKEPCGCGCAHSLLECLKQDGGCDRAREKARAELEKFLRADSRLSEHQCDCDCDCE